jgi:hypothetical protein
MHDDWQLSAQQQDILTRANDISAAIRAADDADDGEWELNDDITFREPFDPFADDPE